MSNVRRELRTVFGLDEHLISSMSLATCRMTNLVSCAAALACLVSESPDIEGFNNRIDRPRAPSITTCTLSPMSFAATFACLPSEGIEVISV